MDCRECQQLIEERLGGGLAPEPERRLRSHVATCEECARLLAAGLQVREELSRAGRSLTAAVMARTTGPACGRARDLLGELADGSLAAADAALVRSHLAACPDCRRLQRTLAWMVPELARLGEVEPPPELAAAVLARTSRAAGAASRPRRLRLALPRWRRPVWSWQRLVLRPRFALESAYAALLILLLLTATPFSPFHRAPARALEVVQAGPGAAFPELEAPVEIAAGRVVGWGRLAWGSASRTVAGGAVALGGDVVSRAALSAPVLRDAGRDVLGAASALVHLEMVESYERLSSARQGLRRLWRIWRGGPGTGREPGPGGEPAGAGRDAPSASAVAASIPPGPADGGPVITTRRSS